MTPLFQPRLFLCVCFALDGLDKLTQPAESDQIVSVHILCLTMTHQQTLSFRQRGAIHIVEHAVYVRTAYFASYIHGTASSVQLAIPYLLPTASCQQPAAG